MEEYVLREGELCKTCFEISDPTRALKYKFVAYSGQLRFPLNLEKLYRNYHSILLRFMSHDLIHNYRKEIT